MTSRSRSPRDPHNRHNTSPDHSTGSAKSTEWLPAALLAVGSLAYAILFFSTQDRFEWLALTLVPDVIVAHWLGGEGSQFAVLDRLPVVVGALTILGLAYAWGSCLLTILERCGSPGRPASCRWERGMLSFASGLPLVSVVTLLVGVLGWLQAPWLAGAMFAGVTGLLGFGGVVWRRAMQTPQATPPRDKSSDDRPVVEVATSPTEIGTAAPATPACTPFEYFLVIIVAGMSLFIVWGGILPPWEFDVREYHLQAPKEWWQSGRISFLPHNVYANMPLGAEMWALAAMIFWPGDEPWWWGALVGKTVIAAVAPLTAGVLIAIGSRLGSRLAGLVAAALYLTTPWTAHVALAGLIDGVVGYYLAAACLVALDWFESRAHFAIPTQRSAAWTSAALVGWLAGAAAACKYPGLVFVAAPMGLCAALHQGWRRFDMRGAAAFALAVTVIAAPWYVKNACVTGNPTYPLFVGVFGGETRTEAKDQQWRDAHRQRDSQGRTYSLPLLAKGIAQIGWRSEWLHPVAMPLVLASLAVHWRRRQVLFLAGLVAWVFAVWWLAGHRIDRFWLPALPLLALLAGLVVYGWPPTSSAWRRTALAFAGVGIALGGLVSCSSRMGDVRIFAPLVDVRQQGQHPLHRELDRIVPPGSRALLVGDAQPFDLSCSVWYSTCFDDSPLAELVASPSAEERRKAFVEARISHVLVDWNEIARYRQPGNYGFPAFVTRELFAELAAGQGVLRLLPGDPRWGELYEVQASPAAD